MKTLKRKTQIAVLALSAAVLLPACATVPDRPVDVCENLPINQVQTIGSHNSYRMMPPATVMDALDQLRPGLKEKLEYEHPAFEDQLDLGLRLLEIDVYADPEGGLYRDPPNTAFLEEGDPIAFDASEITRPGFKVMHIQGYDNYSHCVLLEDCLEQLKQWSDANHDHSLIVVTLNVKEDRVFEDLPLPPKFDSDRLQELDDMLMSMFGADRVLIPDDVRGDAPTLRGAILDTGWPTLAQTRGQFMFVLDEGQPSASLVYRQGHPSLKGRVMFAHYPTSDDEAGYMVYWNLFGREEEIANLVEQGFLVRVASDVGTQEARTNDRSRLNAAIASGAQFIASDYYPGNISPFDTDYLAVFPNGGIVSCDQSLE